MKAEILGKNGMKAVNLNRRTAIRERCLNCASWHPSDVSKCGFQNCSLYPFRLGKGKQNPKNRRKAIRVYCLWCMAGKPSEFKKCVSSLDKSTKLQSIPKKSHIEHDLEYAWDVLFEGEPGAVRAAMKQLSDMPLIYRNQIFNADFDFSKWLKGFANGRTQGTI